MLFLPITLFALGGYVGPVQAEDTSTRTPAAVAPDNTGRNVRDRDDKTLTPFDQSETEADRTLTQRIRQDIVADDSLSVSAKNVKIISANGIVTLRGPVKSEEERARIVAAAQQIAGKNNVQNQLEIAGR
jgi:osmotically-inducible protein OsmY